MLYLPTKQRYVFFITIQILLNNIQKLKHHWQPNLKNLKLKLCTWNKQITIWKRNLIFDQCALHKIQGLVLCHIHKSGMIYRSMLSVETISRHSVDNFNPAQLSRYYSRYFGKLLSVISRYFHSCIGSRIPFYEYTNPIEYSGLLHIAKLQTFYGHSLLLP